MIKASRNKLKTLIQGVPSGLLVDTAWLERRGYSPSTRNHYVRGGWLEHPARGVYRMPGGRLLWPQVIISLQTLMRTPVVVGGRTALHMHGFIHRESEGLRDVHLCGGETPPAWLFDLACEPGFRFHETGRLFPDTPIVLGPPDLNSRVQGLKRYMGDVSLGASFVRLPWGERGWPMVLSTPERAVLEVMAEFPGREGFDEVDKIMKHAGGLSPARMNQLLGECDCMEVKRVFLRFAEHHNHAWLDQIDIDAAGSGGRGRADAPCKPHNALDSIGLEAAR